MRIASAERGEQRALFWKWDRMKTSEGQAMRSCTTRARMHAVVGTHSRSRVRALRDEGKGEAGGRRGVSPMDVEEIYQTSLRT